MCAEEKRFLYSIMIHHFLIFYLFLSVVIYIWCTQKKGNLPLSAVVKWHPGFLRMSSSPDINFEHSVAYHSNCQGSNENDKCHLNWHIFSILNRNLFPNVPKEKKELHYTSQLNLLPSKDDTSLKHLNPFLHRRPYKPLEEEINY